MHITQNYDLRIYGKALKKRIGENVNCHNTAEQAEKKYNLHKEEGLINFFVTNRTGECSKMMKSGWYSWTI